MEHKHDLIIDLSGLIKCRTCGQTLPSAEIELGKVSSAIMANEFLDKIAIEGKYQIISKDEGFPVYSKDKDNIREEVTAKKKTDRVYVIVQKLISKV